MIFRSLTDDNDWTFGRGIAGFATDERALELNLATRLKSWVGNCVFDLQAGIDWKSRLDKGQQQNILNEVRALILQSYGVVGINAISSNLDQHRNLTVRYDITTIFSPSFQRTVAVAAGAGGS